MTTSNERGIGWVGVAVALAIILIATSVITHFWLGPMIFEQNRQSGEQIAKDSFDSDKAVQDYRWFRQQWYDIQAQHEKTQNYEDEHERFHNVTWPDGEWKDSRDARTRHSRLHDRMVASRNMEENMIAEYNARQSDATRAIFQCGLPYNIDEKLFIADATGVEYTSQEAMDRTPPEDPSECEFSGDPDEITASG